MRYKRIYDDGKEGKFYYSPEEIREFIMCFITDKFEEYNQGIPTGRVLKWNEI